MLSEPPENFAALHIPHFQPSVGGAGDHLVAVQHRQGTDPPESVIEDTKRPFSLAIPQLQPLPPERGAAVYHPAAFQCGHGTAPGGGLLSFEDLEELTVLHIPFP